MISSPPATATATTTNNSGNAATATAANVDQQMLQAEFNDYAANYPIETAWPPIITTTTTTTTKTSFAGQKQQRQRTLEELIQHRLIESGVLPEVPIPMQEVLLHLNTFVENMERTDCFHSVRVQLGGGGNSNSDDNNTKSNTNATNTDNNNNNNTANTSQQQQRLEIKLDEKNWYRLHMGGAIKTDQLLGTMTGSTTGSGSGSGHGHDLFNGGLSLPAAELEVSTGLRNLTGTCDTTNLAYTLDTHQIASWSISHERPLYGLVPNPDALLLLANGSQLTFSTKAWLSTVDYEWTRSYKEFQRGYLAQIANHHNVSIPERAPGFYWALQYQALLRDIIPTRLPAPNARFHAASVAASWPIVQQAGPQFKQSITFLMRENGSRLTPNAQMPTQGVDWNWTTELALPISSDAPFVKTHGNLSAHLPLSTLLSSSTSLQPLSAEAGPALHVMFNIGYLHALTTTAKTNTMLLLQQQPQPYGKLTTPCISDRFFVGGPANFRGFLPSGLGPRAAKMNNSRSDALGGDFYYTLTTMASLPLYTNHTIWLQQQQQQAAAAPLRCFVFGTIGTCVGSLAHVISSQNYSSRDTLAALYQSSRISVGCGVATNFLNSSRLEVTYSIPLRYGPMDYRRNVQLGMSFSLDR